MGHHETCQQRLSLAQRCLNLWSTRPKNSYLQNSSQSDAVVNVVMAMNAAACRRYRSVIELCQRGEAEDAEILNRSLFELVLGTAFVLLPNVSVSASFAVNKATGQRKRDKEGNVRYRATKSKGRKTTQDFRARLVIAHSILRDEHHYQEAQATPGLKRYGRTVSAGMRPIVAKVAKAIGSRWTYILRHKPWTYSGMSIKGTASLIGNQLAGWYVAVYGPQSGIVHGSNLYHYVRLDDSGALLIGESSEVSAVSKCLHAANGMFLVGLMLLQKHIGFGSAVETALCGFHREHRSTGETEGKPAAGSAEGRPRG